MAERFSCLDVLQHSGLAWRLLAGPDPAAGEIRVDGAHAADLLHGPTAGGAAQIDLVAPSTRPEASPAAALTLCCGHSLPAMSPATTVVQVSATGSDTRQALLMALARLMHPPVTLAGTLVRVAGAGVLLSGDSGSGKSKLALELICRGGQLIADDSMEAYPFDALQWAATAPALLKDYLHTAELGAINIREVFGDSAVAPHSSIDLLVVLGQAQAARYGDDILEGHAARQRIGEIELPAVQIVAGDPCAPTLVQTMARITAAGIEPGAMGRTLAATQAQTMRDTQR